MDIDRVKHYLQDLQASITTELQAVDGGTTFVAEAELADYYLKARDWLAQ